MLDVGQAARATLTLRNPGPTTVRLERVETSCPCLRVTPGRASIAPGRAAGLDIAYDPGDDPEFHGGLSVVVTGYGSREEFLFRTRVSLTVRERKEGGSTITEN